MHQITAKGRHYSCDPVTLWIACILADFAVFMSILSEKSLIKDAKFKFLRP